MQRIYIVYLLVEARLLVLEESEVQVADLLAPIEKYETLTDVVSTYPGSAGSTSLEPQLQHPTSLPLGKMVEKIYLTYNEAS